MESSMKRTNEVISLLNRTGGILKLQPQFVHRFYPDLNRLHQKSLKKNPRQFIPERWIASSVAAVNPPPIPSGGLSMIHGTSSPLALRDAIKAAPHEMLGQNLLTLHGPEFRCLVKILDPGEAIVFHLHATDAQVKKMPAHFHGHRFGKDEAYYFPESPKGPMPYTHAGLYPGVTPRELVAAVKQGPQYALELSPSIYQEYEHGFFLPAGVPHRPGTALTLEIQQPSDVYTLLETHAAGKPMPPKQIHPGFKSLDQAFSLIDFDVAQAVGKLDKNRLGPKPIRKTSGGQIDWIFPLDICHKFGGKRLRITRSLNYSEDRPFALFIWSGSGTINDRPLHAGDEFFISNTPATQGITLKNTADTILEAFTFFPGL
jgi:hypothetical protein